METQAQNPLPKDAFSKSARITQAHMTFFIDFLSSQNPRKPFAYDETWNRAQEKARGGEKNCQRKMEGIFFGRFQADSENIFYKGERQRCRD